MSNPRLKRAPETPDCNSQPYEVGAALAVAAAVAWRYGVDAERKPLEEFAPLGCEHTDR